MQLTNITSSNAEQSNGKIDQLDFLESIISAKSDAELGRLKQESTKITENLFGNKVYLRGVIEFSNVCEKDCYYCGIRKSNKQFQRYLMPQKEIVEQALWAFQQGYGSVVLQSGELQNNDFIDFVIKTIAEIKKQSKMKDPKGKGLAVVISIGEQKKRIYEELFNAGAHRYLLRIETTNQKLYEKIHPKNHQFKKREKCLEALKEIGYQIGTGIMIGLPEQTVDDLANDILFFKEKDIDMVGMGPYIIHKDTPIGKEYFGEWNKKKADIFQLSLNMIAACRIFLKDVNISSTTALQSLNPFGRELGLQYGANVVMPIITPRKYRSDYLLYDNKPCIDEDAVDCTDCLIARIKNIGKEAALFEWGDPFHFFSRNKSKLSDRK